MKARSVTFWVEKDGSSAAEYEDAACSAEGDPTAGRNPRFVLVDGATEAFDAVRWVGQLVTSFIGDDQRNGQARTPGLDPTSLQDWFAHMQKRWLAEAPAQFTNVIEEIKFHQGSFATLLGCELVDLCGAAPRWHAVAIGDTVLFHVRDHKYRSHFPDLTVEDFGVNPDGIHTKPEALDQMMAALRSAHGDLRVGDRLYLATDALALWMLQRRPDPRLWYALGGIMHDAAFRRLVLDQRASGELHNDDTTLVRIQIVDAEPRFLAVCL